MDSIDNIIKDNKKILEKLCETDVPIAPLASMEIFRNNLLGFIDGQLRKVQRNQALLDLVDSEIVQKVLLHEYDKNEIVTLRNALVGSSTTSISTLLEPFKPTNTSGSALLSPPIEKADDEDISKKLTPAQRQVMDKMMRLLEKAGESKKIVPEKEEEE